jgi:hypothetical protein
VGFITGNNFNFNALLAVLRAVILQHLTFNIDPSFVPDCNVI